MKLVNSSSCNVPTYLDNKTILKGNIEIESEKRKKKIAETIYSPNYQRSYSSVNVQWSISLDGPISNLENK